MSLDDRGTGGGVPHGHRRVHVNVEIHIVADAIEHLYSVIERHRAGFRTVQAANKTRFENSHSYRKISKKNDLHPTG